MIMRLVRDPLLHVLLAGALIYLIYSWMQPPSPDNSDNGANDVNNVIVVDEPALASFIAKRTAATDMQVASARLRAMGEDDLAVLIKDYIREQALLREALRLGFDRDDYVMERRLVQRLEFALLALARTGSRASEDDLRDFYAHNRQRYETPARITFTHVYLNLKQRGEAMPEDAKRLLHRLRFDEVDFAGAMHYGERFLYHRNYVERPFEDIASHFGKDMANMLFAHPPPLHEWSGPYVSTHGTHLVRVRELQQANTPLFEAVRSVVERDHARELEQRALDQAVHRIIDRQPVRIEFTVQDTSHE